MDEIYDIVDKDGNKIREATWTEVHAKGLLHQCSAVLVFKDRSREEILIQKRSASMKQSPNLWQHSAGGHILAGQTPDQGIKREIQEELFTGQDLPKFEIKKVKTFLMNDMPNNYEILNLYEAFYPGPFFYDKKELAEEPEWVSWSDLQKDMHNNPDKYTSTFHIIKKEYEDMKQ